MVPRASKKKGRNTKKIKKKKKNKNMERVEKRMESCA
jgi:hypothetical protein